MSSRTARQLRPTAPISIDRARELLREGGADVDALSDAEVREVRDRILELARLALELTREDRPA